MISRGPREMTAEGRYLYNYCCLSVKFTRDKDHTLTCACAC